MLNAQIIKSYLIDNKTEVYTYDIIDSTNNEAKRLLREGLANNAVFIADEQSGGRGRQGKSFYSPKDTGLYMSVALCGNSASDSLFITTAAAVLTAQAIEEVCGCNVSIKWVNDLYLENKKVCGILTEAVKDAGGNLLGIVVGVGINLNTDVFPDDIRSVATSIGQKVDRNRLSALIAKKLFDANLDENNILTEYKKRSMVLGKEIKYFINNIPHYGTAVDINETGGLIVQTYEGYVTLDSGEITLRLK